MTDVPRPRAAWRTWVPLLAVLAIDLALLVAGVGGWSAFLRHARAQALYAVWVAGTIALAALRPFRDRDAIDTSHERVVVLMLFVLPAITPLLSAWAERAGVWPMPGGARLRDAGVALAALGYALRVLAIVRLGTRFSPLVEVQRRHALETGGVYAIVRHPGYLGAWLGELGVVLAFGSAATAPLAVAMALALGARIRREESTLERHFGEDWRRYRARTGGLLPRPPRHATDGPEAGATADPPS